MIKYYRCINTHKYNGFIENKIYEGIVLDGSIEFFDGNFIFHTSSKTGKNSFDRYFKECVYTRRKKLIEDLIG